MADENPSFELHHSSELGYEKFRVLVSSTFNKFMLDNSRVHLLETSVSEESKRDLLILIGEDLSPQQAVNEIIRHVSTIIETFIQSSHIHPEDN